MSVSSEFLDFFNQKYIKIIFIGRFLKETDTKDSIKYYNVFKKRNQYFVIVEEVDVATNESAVNQESGFWEKEEIINLKKDICLLVEKEILVKNVTGKELETDLFSVNGFEIKFIEGFSKMQRKRVSEEEFNSKI